MLRFSMIGHCCTNGTEPKRNFFRVDTSFAVLKNWDANFEDVVGHAAETVAEFIRNISLT